MAGQGWEQMSGSIIGVSVLCLGCCLGGTGGGSKGGWTRGPSSPRPLPHTNQQVLCHDQSDGLAGLTAEHEEQPDH